MTPIESSIKSIFAPVTASSAILAVVTALPASLPVVIALLFILPVVTAEAAIIPVAIVPVSPVVIRVPVMSGSDITLSAVGSTMRSVVSWSSAEAPSNLIAS